MCLLVAQKEGVTFSDDWLEDFYSRNDDGYGVMYAEDGALHYRKGIGTVEDWVKFYRKHIDKREAFFHLRMRTHGKIDFDNCHPYVVTGFGENKREHPILLMHNGVLNTGNQADATKSDTWHYIRNFLRPMLKKNPDFAFTPEFRQLIGAHITGSNRFALLDAKGRSTIINKHAGVEWADCWFSNTYAWSYTKAVPARTYSYDKTRYGGTYGGGYTGARGPGYYRDFDWGDDYVAGTQLRQPEYEGGPVVVHNPHGGSTQPVAVSGPKKVESPAPTATVTPLPEREEKRDPVHRNLTKAQKRAERIARRRMENLREAARGATPIPKGGTSIRAEVWEVFDYLSQVSPRLFNQVGTTQVEQVLARLGLARTQWFFEQAAESGNLSHTEVLNLLRNADEVEQWVLARYQTKVAVGPTDV